METTAAFRLSGNATLTAAAVTQQPLGCYPSRVALAAGFQPGRIASHATEHAPELDRQTMQRVLALPGDIWLDVVTNEAAGGTPVDHETGNVEGASS